MEETINSMMLRSARLANKIWLGILSNRIESNNKYIADINKHFNYGRKE